MTCPTVVVPLLQHDQDQNKGQGQVDEEKADVCTEIAMANTSVFSAQGGVHSWRIVVGGQGTWANASNDSDKSSGGIRVGMIAIRAQGGTEEASEQLQSRVPTAYHSLPLGSTADPDTDDDPYSSAMETWRIGMSEDGTVYCSCRSISYNASGRLSSTARGKEESTEHSDRKASSLMQQLQEKKQQHLTEDPPNAAREETKDETDDPLKQGLNMDRYEQLMKQAKERYSSQKSLKVVKGSLEATALANKAYNLRRRQADYDQVLSSEDPQSTFDGIVQEVKAADVAKKALERVENGDGETVEEHSRQIKVAGGGFVAGDVLVFELDFSNNTLTLWRNGVCVGALAGMPTSAQRQPKHSDFNVAESEDLETNTAFAMPHEVMQTESWHYFPACSLAASSRVETKSEDATKQTAIANPTDTPKQTKESTSSQKPARRIVKAQRSKAGGAATKRAPIENAAVGPQVNSMTVTLSWLPSLPIFAMTERLAAAASTSASHTIVSLTLYSQVLITSPTPSMLTLTNEDAAKLPLPSRPLQLEKEVPWMLPILKVAALLQCVQQSYTQSASALSSLDMTDHSGTAHPALTQRILVDEIRTQCEAAQTVRVESSHPLRLDAPSPVRTVRDSSQYSTAMTGGASTINDDIRLLPGHKLVEKTIRLSPSGTSLRNPWQYKGEVGPDGLPSGYGSGKKADGSHYEGMWKKGVKTGFGVWVSKKLQVHKGQWEDDKPCGWGTR
jgi:hypothetical protein